MMAEASSQVRKQKKSTIKLSSPLNGNRYHQTDYIIGFVIIKSIIGRNILAYA